MDTETETKIYEADYILKGDLDEEKALEASESFRKLIENEQGIITQESKPQKQNLGYPIKKHRAGYFGSLKFIFPVEKIQALKNSFEKNDFLRLLLVETKHEKEMGQIPLKRQFRQPATGGAVRQAAVKKTPTTLKKEEVTIKEPLRVEEIDKKLEEILGK
jgi:ribosomal protein S6